MAGSVWEALGLPGAPGGPGWVEAEAARVLGGDPAHGWPHVLRVAGWARRIVEAEGLGVDWEVLYLAVVLHDVGRGLPGRGHHAVKSAGYARRLLAGRLPDRVVERVAHAVLAHSYSLGVEARSAEARVLSDADKLDALGAIGVARVFHTGCQLGRGFEDSLRHFEEKILRLPTLMHYESSRRWARQLARRVEAFLEWWRSEEG